MNQLGLREGHCGPISAIWLRMRMTEQNPDINTYLATPNGQASVLELKQKQNTGVDWSYVKTFFRQKGFGHPTQSRFAPTQLMLNLDRVTSPGYHFVSFGNRGVAFAGVSHAIAVDSRANTLFDPNHGQFTCFSPRILLNWLHTLLREHYDEMLLGNGQILSFTPVVIHGPVVTRDRR